MDTLTVERAPVGMGLGRRGDRIYAANRGTGRVSVIDRQSGREWARVPVGKAPGDLAVDQTIRGPCTSRMPAPAPSASSRIGSKSAARRAAERLAASPDREAAPGLQPAGHGDGTPAHVGGVPGEEVHPELLRQLVRACQAEAPLLEEVRKRAEKYGLEIVMVNVWEHVDPRQEALHFCKIHNIQGRRSCSTRPASTSRKLGIRGVPAQRRGRQEGIVRAVGVTTPDEVRATLTKLLCPSASHSWAPHAPAIRSRASGRFSQNPPTVVGVPSREQDHAPEFVGEVSTAEAAPPLSVDGLQVVVERAPLGSRATPRRRNGGGETP